ncbi:hypothetical protein NOX90_01875 [Wolbachia endosymbiont of Anurida maritima]|uniref:hypothetical protein n=1 Tax=Wolbachia endosymbiont of Anurida maritima TaxID=2850562 RepID=UPI0035D05AC6
MQRQYVKCYGRFCLKHKGVIQVADTGIDCALYNIKAGFQNEICHANCLQIAIFVQMCVWALG